MPRGGFPAYAVPYSSLLNVHEVLYLVPDLSRSLTVVKEEFVCLHENVLLTKLTMPWSD